MLAFGISESTSSLGVLLDAVEGDVYRVLPQCNEQNLSNMAWALSVACAAGTRTTTRRLTAALLVELKRRNPSTFTQENLRQLYQLHMTLVATFPEAPPAMSASFYAAARTAWADTMKTHNQASPAARVVHRMMVQSMHLTARLQHTSPDGNFLVDIEYFQPGQAVDSSVGGSGETRAGRIMALEVDGPDHFMRNDPTMQDGSSRLRDYLLTHSYGWAPVSLNVTEQSDWAQSSVQNHRQSVLQRLVLQPLRR